MRRGPTPPPAGGLRPVGSSEIFTEKVMFSPCKLCKGLVLQGSFSGGSWGRGENAGRGQRASHSSPVFSEEELITLSL